MAIKYYGVCSGNAGAKYNIWLEVAENSQSVENNTSNVIVKLKLKRNDGYAGSAYNLNKSENFAKITINNDIVTSANIEIDTRNNVTVTLLSWRGDISHNADGSLSLKISGEFAMSGTSLAGGSASGNFQCVAIPRSSSFTLNKTSIVPDEEIAVTINSNSSEFSHKLIFELGDNLTNFIISPGVNEQLVLIPKEWATALPKSKQGTIIITLKTYSGTKVVGSYKKQIGFIIPEKEEYLPEYSVNVKANKNGIVPANWSAVIQNKSTLTVKMHNIIAKYGASVISGYIIVGNIKKYGTEAEFDLPVSGTINILTHVEDSRGFIKEEKMIFDVAPYSLPTINCNALLRCDSLGGISENGTSAYIDFTPTFSSVWGLNYCRCYVKYKDSNKSEFSEPILMTESPFIIDGNFQTNASYDFLIYITDAVETTPFEISRTLPSGYIPFNIRKGGKGAAFGCYSENENELTVGYNLNVKGQIVSENLSNTASSGAGFYINKIDIKSYSCLALTLIKAELLALNSINNGIWVELLKLNNITLAVNTPLNIVTGDYNVDKNIKCFIDTSGVIKLISEIEITKDTKIYINGLF